MKYLLFLALISCTTVEAVKTEKITFVDDYWPKKEPCNKNTEIIRNGKCNMAPKDLIDFKVSNQKCKDKRKGKNRCVVKVYINERCHVYAICGETK